MSVRAMNLGRARGFTLMELIVVIGLLAILTSQAVGLFADYTSKQVARLAAKHHKSVETASIKYLEDNYKTILSGSLPKTIGIDSLKGDYLPPSMFNCASTPCQLLNQYGQNYKIVVSKAGTAPNFRLDAMLLTEGGQSIGLLDSKLVARMIGPAGGYVESGNATGAMSGWKETGIVAKYGAGANVGDGHLASMMFFSDGLNQTDYLYRSQVTGKPELNRMNTDLDMGGNSINAIDTLTATSASIDTLNSTTVNAKDVNGEHGHFSRDGAGQCCGDKGSISLAENTSVTGRSASISLHNGGVSAGTIELATSGERRVLFKDNQGSKIGVEATGNVRAQGDVFASVFRSNVGGYIYDNGSYFEVSKRIHSLGDVTANGNISGNAVYGNLVQSNGRLVAGEYAQINGVATEGAGCSPNGLVGRDPAGALLSCQSGMWKKGGSGSYVITGLLSHGQQIPLPPGFSPSQCQWSVANATTYHHGKPFYYGGGVAYFDGNRIVTCGFRDDWNFYPSGQCSYVTTCR
ncbi:MULTISPECIES: shufflon system plasmid conjugative transfer pilus tip adhesin PilV [Aeromonas]|uniref:shufflon system plasmid conjugative transfer pilus tip adhesin PilV n=1 Tax=Aeromonas TaxID=642 RepID=UPI002B055E3B|nr:shufflon system plasmid conjugative transfer pilus tip adhesin PilV [Aeromonas jandaei]